MSEAQDATIERLQAALDSVRDDLRLARAQVQELELNNRNARADTAKAMAELDAARADFEQATSVKQKIHAKWLETSTELEASRADVARLRAALEIISRDNHYKESWRVAEEALTTATPVVPPHSHSPSSSTYPLFEHMSREHGLTLVESELDEIRHAVARCGDVVPLEEAEATVRKP